MIPTISFICAPIRNSVGFLVCIYSETGKFCIARRYRGGTVELVDNRSFVVISDCVYWSGILSLAPHAVEFSGKTTCVTATLEAFTAAYKAK